MKQKGMFQAALLFLMIITDAMVMIENRQRYTSYVFGTRVDLKLTKNSESPQCNICPGDVALCCPLTVPCGSDGKCPQEAKEEAGYIEAGQAVVQRD